MIWRILSALLLLSSFTVASLFPVSPGLFAFGGVEQARVQNVAPENLALVCPGAYWQLGGAAGTKSGRLDRLGSTSMLVSLGSETELQLDNLQGATAKIDAQPTPRAIELSRETASALEAIPDPSGANTPEQIAARQGSKQLGAVSIQRVNTERGSGLLGANCVQTGFQVNLLAGSTTAARESLLILVNPNEIDSQLTLTLFSEAGQIDIGSAGQIAVAAGATEVISLASLAGEAQALFVRVEATEAPIAAWLQHKKTRGTLSSGLALLSSGSQLGRELVLPGLFIREPERIAKLLASDRDFADAQARLRLFSLSDAQVTVEIVGATKETFGTVFSASLQAGKVQDIAIADLESGDYAVFVSSDKEVQASLMLSRLHPSKAEGRASDFSWLMAAPRLLGEQAFATPTEGVSKLSIANPNDEPILLSLTTGDSSQAIAIGARSTVTVELLAGRHYSVAGDLPYAVTLVLDQDFALASWPLLDFRNSSTEVSLLQR